MTQKPKVQMIDINLLSRFIKAQGLNLNLSFYVEDNPNMLFHLADNKGLTPNGQYAAKYLLDRNVPWDEVVLAVMQLNQIIEQCFKDAPKNGEKKFVLGQRFV